MYCALPIHTHIQCHACPYKVRAIVQDNLQKLEDRAERLDDLGERAGTCMVWKLETKLIIIIII